MTTVRLAHNTAPEKAEAQIDRAVSMHPHDAITVRLNGFSGARFHTIAGRLPDGWKVRSLGPNSRLLVPVPGVGDKDQLTVFSANFDWANAPSADVRDATSLLAHHADAVLGVELTSAGRPITRLSKLFPGWHAHQGKSGGKAMAGVAVSPEYRTGSSGFALGIGHRPGVKLGVRWITWQDVYLAGRRVRLIAVHLPPQRFHFLWPVYAANIAAVVRSSPFPVIMGGDYNSTLSGPEVAQLARLCGLKRYGVGIDGILYSPQLAARPAPTVTNAATRSDHPFPGLTFTWRG